LSKNNPAVKREMEIDEFIEKVGKRASVIPRDGQA
jgi:hypothetical protein